MKTSAPRISVLIPSRGRPGLLEGSLRSWGWTPRKSLPNIEFLIAVDEDDPCINDYVDTFGWLCDSLSIVPRWGYDYLDMYYNYLAELAGGDWLILWNDDASLTEDTWQRLRGYDAMLPWIIKLNPIGAFIAVSRKAYEIMEHFTTGMSCDGYLMDVGQQSGVLASLDDDSIRHLRDVIHDSTEQDKNKAIAGWFKTGRHLTNEEMEQKNKDIRRLKKWLRSRS